MFKEKKTCLQNLAFSGIIAGINVLLGVMATYVPFSTILIMIILPFFSATVSIFCKHRYYLIYAIATIGVTIAIAPYDMEFVFCALIPSIISGFLFGLCIIHKLNGIYAILFSSLSQFCFTYLSIPLINIIYETDLILDFLVALKLNNNISYVNVMVPSFIYLLSLIEITFSYSVLNNEISKIINIDERPINVYVKYFGLLLSLLVIFLTFFFLNIAYLLMFISLFIAISILINEIFNINQRKITIIYILLAMSGFIFVFALYQLIKKPYCLILLNISNILIYGYNLLYNLVRDKKTC